jgi:hypothetical protein
MEKDKHNWRQKETNQGNFILNEKSWDMLMLDLQWN